MMELLDMAQTVKQTWAVGSTRKRRDLHLTQWLAVTGTGMAVAAFRGEDRGGTGMEDRIQA